MTLRLAVLASGGGSNLQAMIDRFNARTDAPLHVALVISDRADAGALRRASNAGIATAVVAATNRPESVIAAEMLAKLDAAGIDLIALAGYLKLIPGAVVRRYPNRIVNIHPALLPAFGGKGMYGLRVHRAVIDSGCAVSGATVHYVDENYDEGRVIAQWPVPVRSGDTPETLAARVLEVEHMLFPAALELAARNISSDEPLSARVSAESFITQQHAPDEAELRRALGVE